MLNQTILHVASKCLDFDLSGCLGKFVGLGTRASLWCAKHLKMSTMSTEESPEEEHCSVFFQLLLDCLNFSVASISVMNEHSLSSDDEALMVTVENFVLEQLKLTKETIAQIKRIDSLSQEALKAAQIVIDSVIRLCKEYSQAVNWDVCDAELEKDKGNGQRKETNIRNHVISITAITVEKLCELGILAAKDGGNLVSILNISWKGVVTLLQHGKWALAAKVKVADIILSLISLVNESLQYAAEAWSSEKETISVTEARRTFVPVKFYLINAVKISMFFPRQAYLVYKDITLCVLMISFLKFLLSQEKLFKIASEIMTELLEKTSMDLVNSLLNSVELEQDLKHEILDCLFVDEGCTRLTQGDSSNPYWIPSCSEIFSASLKGMTETRVLLLGRVALFHSFLQYSLEFEEDMKLAIATKLGWFLDILTDEKVYSCILVSQIPMFCGSGRNVEFVWEPVFSAVLLALKTFMLVISSSLAWGALESFLLKNFFHPHFLCWDIVMELWCFLMRHAEINMMNDIILKLCSVLKSVISPESVLSPGSALRKMVRSICMILTYGTPATVDVVYNCVAGDGRSQSSTDMCIALLLEGFPLNLLSENMRNIATKRIINDYLNFIENFDGKCSSSSDLGNFGAPIYVLSTSLHSLQISVSDIDMKTLKFLVAVIHKLKNPPSKVMKDHFYKLLSEILAIISNLNHLYLSDEMEDVILGLQSLFISGQVSGYSELHGCKSDLALFLAGLSHMQISESDGCPRSSAVWELYHILLRERHWLLVHLAVTAFGYFCARTTCNQLWRFVPQDAALAYDHISGNEANEERFMAELKIFLEKELALLSVAPCSEQLVLLQKEGLVLKEMLQKCSSSCIEVEDCQSMEIDGKSIQQRRKLPDEISKGVELLQNGMKAISDGLSQWKLSHLESVELRNKFLTQFSCLEDVISHLVGLTNSH
ncbi:LOW QUALITY PROTEIN: uncharacterized protein LOC110814019 [Carica papaya]|uniref:LOW QUALITY PROTEIN: uncharacterized protein LOC110814019 n=1 Tax=Carica papaya TaxID=3649 RepID=UPI000B8C8FD6|nr:LOW QUALITY PROTEIN: uncharacterized protein LOC110814019 [Carica papaya]